MKRLFALLLACFMLFLAGCAEKAILEKPDPNSAPVVNETQTGTPDAPKTGVLIEDAQLSENFRLVCEQIGIDTNKISDWTQGSGWVGGPSYTCTYNGLELYVLCSIDSTIEAISIGEQETVFSKRMGAYRVDEYVPDPELQAQVEAITQSLIKKELDLPEEATLPLAALSVTRTLHIYNTFGGVSMTDENGEEVPIPFALCFEHDEESEQIHLRYFTLGGTEIANTTSEIVLPESAPAVKQTGTPITVEDNEILIIEGELGEYGKEVEYAPGEVYINYYLPTGIYQVTSLVPTCALYVQNNESTTDENGRLVFEQISETVFEGVGDKHEIKVEEGQHIAPTFFAKVVFEPIT